MSAQFQYIPLRGHRDDQTSTSLNKGNFLALLEFRSEAGDSVLCDHFQNASSRATYTSKTIQNEVIEICGEYIRNKLLAEVKSAKYFSIMADEASDSSKKEQLSLVLRFVDENLEIREEFLGFKECESGTSGEALTKMITDCITKELLPGSLACTQKQSTHIVLHMFLICV